MKIENRDFLLSLVLSPEMAAMVATAYLYSEHAAALVAVIQKVATAPEQTNWLYSAVPVALQVLAMTLVKEIFFPSDEAKDVFKKWPEFFLLKNRVYSGLIYATLGNGLLITFWLIKPLHSDAKWAALSVLGASWSLLATGGLWLASVRVKLILSSIEK